jgi:hypothetical protein
MSEIFARLVVASIMLLIAKIIDPELGQGED